MVATVKELRFGDAALDLHRRHHEAFDRLRTPQRRPFRSLVVDGFFLRRVVEVEGIGGKRRRILPDQGFLFLGPLAVRRGPGRAVGIAHLFRELDDLGLEDLVEERLPHRVGRGVDLGGLGFDGCSLGTLLGGVERIDALSRGTPLLPVVDRVEDRAEPKVVGLRDRIVAVVVALGAGDGEPEERGRRHLDLFGDHLISGEVLIGNRVAGAVGGEAEEGRGDELVAAERIVDGVCGRLLGRSGQLVPGKLLLDEAIPGEVVLKTLHDPVAVAPGMRAERIGLGEAVGIGIAHDIEPRAGLPLGVGRARQQPFHDPLISVARGVGDEGRDLLRSGQEAGEVEGEAAEERRTVGFRGEDEPLGPERLKDEGIDRSSPGCRVGQSRHGWFDDWLERPPRPVAGCQIRARRNRFRLRLDGARAGGDPALDRGELLRRHLLSPLRHLAGADDAEELASAWIARHEERPVALGLTVEEPAQTEVDAPLHRILFAVALGAMGLEDRPDISLPRRACVGAERLPEGCDHQHRGGEPRNKPALCRSSPRHQCPPDTSARELVAFAIPPS